MGHITTTTQQDTFTRDFLDCMQRGDDFFKIELLRPAKFWYTKALEYDIDSEKVLQKISQCNTLLAHENKVIIILSSLAAASIALYLLFIR